MNPSGWIGLAALSYAASCVLGTGVQLRWWATDRARWVHHALYVCTMILIAIAVSTVAWTASSAGWFLAPALLPLSVIPFAGSHSSRHIYLALSAAPFVLVSLIVSWR